jgi:spermidine synthase
VRLPFEQLAWDETPMGVLSLHRRTEPATGDDVFEVKLGDEYLMSSQFTAAEVQLARLGLAAAVGTDLDVVVGGLGLGYTAAAALEEPRVRSLTVVEALGEVIDWHEQGLLPAAGSLTSDERCTLVRGDFFALAASAEGFDPTEPGRRFDAILLDVDHTPRHVLHPSHASFYTVEGLQRLAGHLRPDGVFALWSDDPPDASFLEVLDEVFDTGTAHVVTFPNVLTGGESANTVYVAR